MSTSKFIEQSMADPGRCIFHKSLHVLVTRHHSLSPACWLLMPSSPTRSISSSGSERRPVIARPVLMIATMQLLDALNTRNSQQLDIDYPCCRTSTRARI